MARSHWKIAGVLAIGYVVLTLISVSIGTKVPELGTSRADIVSDFSSGSAVRMYGGCLVTGLAMLAFIAVAAFLSRALRSASEGATWLATAALAAGAGFAVVGGLDPVLLSASVYGGHHGADPGALELINVTRNFVLYGSYLVLGGFTLAAAAAVLVGKALPRWVGYTGLAVGVLLIVPVSASLGFLLSLVWMIALGVAMLASRRVGPARGAPAQVTAPVAVSVP